MPGQKTEKYIYPEPLSKGAIFVNLQQDGDELIVEVAALLYPKNPCERWRSVTKTSLEPGDNPSDAELGGMLRRLIRRVVKDAQKKSVNRIELAVVENLKRLGS